MSNLHPLIVDLALILISAGIMTLIFKRLKQPLVLGYIMAGFLASPHLTFTPSVVDTANIQTWADIGVIFLLFALGLEFSFKKIVKVGGAAVIATCTILFCMILAGVSVGLALGWPTMDCIFLGGMVSMSSTTIIYKAFDDMGLRDKQFSGLVLSILILEDILAILLLVMLSTVAASSNFEGSDLIYSISKLVFFLVLWFAAGIYIIPTVLKLVKKLMTDETLLVVALGMCFGMVVMAANAGFSPAFGAFMMGSILAETLEAEKIGRLVKPVKDLFGAVFFVSVGMMVNPAMVARYAVPILVITLVVVLGQAVFGTFGVLLSGKPLKTSIQCGFCLTQIGEFAFIIAALGVSLHVTSNFLYPIVVAVSVITTFLTPYMIRLAGPAYELADRKLPLSWKGFLNRFSSGTQTVNHDSKWKQLLISIFQVVVLYSILSIAVVIFSFKYMAPFILGIVSGFWGHMLATILAILLMAPFLLAIVVARSRSEIFKELWNDNHFNRGHLVATVIVRVVISIVFVMVVISHFFRPSSGWLVGVATIVVFVLLYSRSQKRRFLRMEERFIANLNSRGQEGEAVHFPRLEQHLLDKNIHFADYLLPASTDWGGKTLEALALHERFGVHVVAICRGDRRITIPNGADVVFPQDKIEVIGTDEQLGELSHVIRQSVGKEGHVPGFPEMLLKQFTVGLGSSLVGRSISGSDIRRLYKCMVVGIEDEEGKLSDPDVHSLLREGEILWIVGEKDDLRRLVADCS